MHSREGACACMEEKADLVSDRRGRPDDPGKDAAVYGGAHESNYQNRSFRSHAIVDYAQAGDRDRVGSRTGDPGWLMPCTRTSLAITGGACSFVGAGQRFRLRDQLACGDLRVSITTRRMS